MMGSGGAAGHQHRSSPGPGAGRWASRWGWLLIAAVVALVYWPLSTFTYGLVDGDTLDCWVPWRGFIASAMLDGQFPLWDPYAQGGYPIYADLQGPAWYPLSMALAGTLGHTVITLQALYLLYVTLGGIGMMRLVRWLHGDARIGLLVGLAYALGGFFTAHQMHSYAIISAAWLPWLFAAQLRLMAAPGWRPAVEAALVQALLLTGGNHTFTLIGTWLLLALIIAHGLRYYMRGDRARWLGLVRYEALFALLAGLMACGTLFAWWEVSPFIDRAHGVAYDSAASNPFSWRAFLSYVSPYAAHGDAAWLGTDPTMANGYTGVLLLLLAVLALFRRRSLTEHVIGAFGLLSALASLGAALPVHHVLWSVVPGLDLFRFPSYYQWFVALAVCVLAGGTLTHWGDLWARRGKVMKWFSALVGLAVLALLVHAGFVHVREPSFPGGGGLYAWLTGVGHSQRLLLSLPAVLVALAGFFYWAARPGSRWPVLFVAVVIEMGWNTTLAQWNTAVGDHSPRAMQVRIDRQPRGPVWPELLPMGRSGDGSVPLKWIWRNVQNFGGAPSHDGFNSFWLSAHDRLAADHPALFAAMKRQPVVYLADSVIAADAYRSGAVDPVRDSGLVVLDPGVNMTTEIGKDAADSLWITGFDPCHFALGVRTARGAFAVLQQNRYPGWQAFINGEPAALVPANIAVSGVPLPAGTHTLEFRFTKPAAPWLLALSLAVFLACAAALAFAGTAGAATLLGRAALVVFTLALAWSLFGPQPKAERLPHEIKTLLAHMADGEGADAPWVLNTDRLPALLPALGDRTPVALRAGTADRAAAAVEVAGREGRAFWWLDAGLPCPPEVRAALLARYRPARVLGSGSSSAVLLAPGEGGLEAVELHVDCPPGGLWLNEPAPWTDAWTADVGEMAAQGPGFLLVRSRYRTASGQGPKLVIEREQGGRTVDYEAIALGDGRDGAGEREAWHAYDLGELRHRGGRLRMYLWNPVPDSLLMQEFSVLQAGPGLAEW